jgi:hypothetical protein
MENKEPCQTCGAADYFYMRVAYAPEGRFETCSECKERGSLPNVLPDVYFDPSKGANQTDPNLCDRYKGQIPFSSKREKAAILKNLGLRECGDKEHGGRNFDRHAAKQWDQH